MAPLVELALTAVAFIGHFSIAVWLFNRLHAVALPRRLRQWSRIVDELASSGARKKSP